MMSTIKIYKIEWQFKGGTGKSLAALYVQQVYREGQIIRSRSNR